MSQQPQNNQQRKQGMLSRAGAARLNRPELAGELVEYIEHPHAEMASHIYYQDEYIGGTLSFGEAGLIRKEHFYGPDSPGQDQDQQQPQTIRDLLVTHQENDGKWTAILPEQTIMWERGATQEEAINNWLREYNQPVLEPMMRYYVQLRRQKGFPTE